MTRQIPVYDIGINESIDVQRRKQKALAENFGIELDSGEKLLYLHSFMLLSSISGLVPPSTPDYEEKLEEWRAATHNAEQSKKR